MSIMRKHKWAKVGDHVFYEDREGRVLNLTHIFDGTPALDLEDINDPEMTCMAKEAECNPIEEDKDEKSR